MQLVKVAIVTLQEVRGDKMDSLSTIPNSARIFGYYERSIFRDFIRDIKRRGFVLHHKASFGTHFSKKVCYVYVTPYRGKFGNGYIIHLPSNELSGPNKHPIFYYISEDHWTDESLKNLLFSD